MTGSAAVIVFFLGFVYFLLNLFFIYVVFLRCLSSYEYVEQTILPENLEGHIIQRQSAGSAGSRVCCLSARIWGVHGKGNLRIYGVTGFPEHPHEYAVCIVSIPFTFRARFRRGICGSRPFNGGAV